jgi:hypothetical protein
MKKIIILRDKIQDLDKFHQLEILRIFKTNNINHTENRNGIFINMNDLDKTTLAMIDKYLHYVSTQQDQLDIVEQKKEQYKLSFFKNDKESGYNI